jgi:hypothetical protein
MNATPATDAGIDTAMPLNPEPLAQLSQLVQLQMQQQNQQAQQIQQLYELVNKQMLNQPAAVIRDRPAQSSTPPPLVKPAKPSTFSGGRKNNARTWLSEMERYLAFMKVPEYEVVPFVVTHFRDAASVWYDNICQQEIYKHTIQQWDTFKQLFLDNFQPVEASRTARSVLYHLKQRGSVADYCDVFRSYLNQINKMEVDDQIFLFLNGLNPTIAKEVNMQQPKTLAQAMNIAQRADIENRTYNNPRRSWNGAAAYRPFTSFVPSVNNPAPAPVPMELGNIQYDYPSELQEPAEPAVLPQQETASYGYDQLHQVQRVQNLSREQMERMKQNGLCFRCGLPGHMARNCSSRPGPVSNRNNNYSGTPHTQQPKNSQRRA